MGKKKGRRKGPGKFQSGKQEVGGDVGLGDEDGELKAKFPSGVADDDEDLYEDDIDKYHNQKDKILLEKAGGQLLEDDEPEKEEEEEMFKFDDSSSDDGSDAEMNEMIKIQMNRLKRQGKGVEPESEDEEEEEGEEKKKTVDKTGTWGGTKSSAYYGADLVDSDEEDEEENEEAEQLELEEALQIQKRTASKFDDDDFGFGIFQQDVTEPAAKSDSKKQETIVTDISKLSKTDKRKLLKKESPEFLGLMKDYKEKLVELKDRIQPLYNLVSNGNIPDGGGADYVRAKYDILMGYCINMGFYTMLKAKKTPVVNHPVIKRLMQYKKLMQELESMDLMMESSINKLLQMVEDGMEIKPLEKVEEVVEEKKEEMDSSEEEEEGEKDEMPDELPSGGRGGLKRKKPKATDEIEEKLKKMRKLKSNDLTEEGETEQEEKRKASKEMEKNRGLTPHKRKDLKNPRVRLREKYRKAKIRRKGAVREARFEMVKYGGETSGIRAGLKKGIKIKS